MKLLLDECLPRKLKREFVGQEVSMIDEAGFKGLKNGILIQSASEAGFEVLISADKNIEHQQNKTIYRSRFYRHKTIVLNRFCL